MLQVSVDETDLVEVEAAMFHGAAVLDGADSFAVV